MRSYRIVAGGTERAAPLNGYNGYSGTGCALARIFRIFLGHADKGRGVSFSRGRENNIFAIEQVNE